MKSVKTKPSRTVFETKLLRVGTRETCTAIWRPLGVEIRCMVQMRGIAAPFPVMFARRKPAITLAPTTRALTRVFMKMSGNLSSYTPSTCREDILFGCKKLKDGLTLTTSKFCGK